MKAAGGILLLALVLGASASGADDPPTEPEDLIARDVERTYFFHRIRDHCLLGRRPWEFFLRIHYRSTHLADATVDREWNDRGPLRALQRWGIGALSGPVWFAWLTLASAVLLGLARTWRRMGAARRARWIVPALLGAGLVAWGAYPAFAPRLRDLHRARGRGDREALVRALGDADAGRRAEAAHALAYLAGDGDRGPLRAALADPDPRVALWGATSLARLRDVQSFAPLRDLLLNHPEPLVRSHAAHALGAIGLEEGLPVLTTAAARPGETLYTLIQIRWAIGNLRKAVGR